MGIRATGFEFRHQTLLHLSLVGLALLTYAFDPDDIVWALVRNHTNSALLERMVFGLGALIFLVSAVLQTWAVVSVPVASKNIPDYRKGWRRYLRDPTGVARLLFACALGLLLPLAGAILLLVGEAILVLRLFLRDAASLPEFSGPIPGKRAAGFRSAVSKLGLAVTMIIFVVTLRDRVAEIGATLSVLAWMALNFWPTRRLQP